MRVVVIQSFNPWELQTYYYVHDVNIFETSIFIIFTESVMFCFRIASFPYKFFLNSCMIGFGIVFTNARCTIFEIARVLKTVILPAIERSIMLQIRKFFSIFIICFLKFSWISSLSLLHLIPQSATCTPLRAPMPAVSHLLLFGLSPETSKMYRKCSLTLLQTLYL